MKPLMKACKYSNSQRCRSKKNKCYHSVLHLHREICDQGSDCCPKCEISDADGLFESEDFEL